MTDGRPRLLRLRGEAVYAASRGGTGGEVWRVGDGTLVPGGRHDLESWVDRAAFADRIATEQGSLAAESGPCPASFALRPSRSV